MYSFSFFSQGVSIAIAMLRFVLAVLCPSVSACGCHAAVLCQIDQFSVSLVVLCPEPSKLGQSNCRKSLGLVYSA